MPRFNSPDGLSVKQRRFVDEYLVDLNATAAYKRAGYAGQGNVAEVNGHRMLRNAKIAAAIGAAQTARSHRTGITQDNVIHEIALLQHSTIEHYRIDDHGNIVLAPGAPPDAMRAISGLKKKIIHTESGIIYETEFRLWNKPASLRMGGQHLGLFKEHVEVSGTVKVVRLPEKAPSVDAWSQRHHGPGRGTDLGTPAEAN